MKAINRLRQQLENMGVSIDEEDYFLCCDAPSGYAWQATGTTSLTIHYATNRQSWLTKAIASEMDSLKMGLYRIDDAGELATIEHGLGEEWKTREGSPERIEWI